MILIEYVIQNEEDIDLLKIKATKDNLTIEEYILDLYCPSEFKCLTNTPYKKPFVSYKKNKNDCVYRYTEDLNKCLECWNREIKIL